MISTIQIMILVSVDKRTLLAVPEVKAHYDIYI
jgi:hypothetical protein